MKKLANSFNAQHYIIYYTLPKLWNWILIKNFKNSNKNF